MHVKECYCFRRIRWIRCCQQLKARTKNLLRNGNLARNGELLNFCCKRKVCHSPNQITSIPLYLATNILRHLLFVYSAITTRFTSDIRWPSSSPVIRRSPRVAFASHRRCVRSSCRRCVSRCSLDLQSLHIHQPGERGELWDVQSAAILNRASDVTSSGFVIRVRLLFCHPVSTPHYFSYSYHHTVDVIYIHRKFFVWSTRVC